MNRLEHLLDILQEECAEVIHATSKALRFGLDDGAYTNLQHENNEVRMRAEVNDIRAMIEMLENEGLNLRPNLTDIQAKIDKVEKHLLYSKKRGTLNE